MRVERELMRGAGPVAVLKLLADGPMYGYQLGEALARRSEGVLDMGQGTLYPMLYNLEAKGLVESFLQDGPSEEGGRERKYYKLTEKGKKKLATDMAQWSQVAKAMTGLGVLGAEPARLAIAGLGAAQANGGAK
jgi:PadR family transcriptional regulator PadR